MTDLSPYCDLLLALRSASSKSLAKALSRRIIEAREGRGDYAYIVQGEIAPEVKELMAHEVLKREWPGFGVGSFKAIEEKVNE